MELRRCYPQDCSRYREPNPGRSTWLRAAQARYSERLPAHASNGEVIFSSLSCDYGRAVTLTPLKKQKYVGGTVGNTGAFGRGDRFVKRSTAHGKATAQQFCYIGLNDPGGGGRVDEQNAWARSPNWALIVTTLGQWAGTGSLRISRKQSTCTSSPSML